MQRADDDTFQIQLSLRILDPLLLMLLAALTYWLRFAEGLPLRTVPGLFAGGFAAALMLHATNTYQALHCARLDAWLRPLVTGIALLLGLFLLIAFAMQVGEAVSRFVVIATAIQALVLLGAARVLAFYAQRRRHRQGVGVERVLLVGDEAMTASCAHDFARHAEAGLLVVGRLGREVIATLPEAVRVHVPDRVVVCARLGDQELLDQVLVELRHTPIVVQFAPALPDLPFLTFRVGERAGRILIDVSDAPWSDGDRTLKWIEDKAFATLILICVAPLLVLIAVAVKVTSPGPVFFLQARHGLNGRAFRVFKFRTMCEVPLRPVAAGAAGPAGDESAFVQARVGDLRVTWLGRILRQTSLDELPQFFNVLRGDMSIVGPRPHPLALNHQYLDAVSDLMRRHYVKPGITGLAQISGARGETRTVESMRRRVQFDLEYIHRWSLWLDLRIILVTAVKGFFNRHP